MKKIIMFVLTLACLAVAFFLVKDQALSYLKTFSGAFGEVEQWKTLM